MMNSRNFKSVSLMLLLAPLISCESSRLKPNVVIVITDDQGYGDLSAHGHPYLQTPGMDMLHGESVRLTNFHVAPVCAPTRSQLLTGIDAMHIGAYYICINAAGRSSASPVK